MTTKRFLILPAEGLRLSDSHAASVETTKLLGDLQPGHAAATRSLGRRLNTLAAQARGAAPPPPDGEPVIELIKSLGEDSVKLVRTTEEVAVALRQQNPGLRVIEEKFCTPARAPRVHVPPAQALPAAGPAVPVVVEVVRADTGAPVPDADVIAFRSASNALRRRTNAQGKASFNFGTLISKFSKLYVYHEHPGAWAYLKSNVTVSNGKVQVKLAAVDLSAVDSLRYFHGAGELAHGAGVRVGVIDSGAESAHPDLKDAIEGGANCVPGSSRPAGDYGPDGSHGTHVAGTIAARGTAPAGMRGVAPGARLWIYRVFETGNDGNGSSFAVIDAIDRAIKDGCDIINMSLSFDQGVTDDAITEALRKARNRGVLAIAAAGNDGRQEVSFPASDDNCVAVSATGRKGTFPTTATETGDIASPPGADPKNFIAAFSNVGVDLDMTGAGVGVISTVPGGHGPMSGTSMASPAVAGVAARLLAANPAVMNLPRDAARTDAMRKLLVQAAATLGFGVLLEGAGLPK